jgi:uncharacterized glyoxalase superfamily protein PhnB
MPNDSSSTAGGDRRQQPESFRARTLQASLTVKDVEKSVAWYRDVVGFTIDQRHERNGKLVAVSIKAGDVRILLGQDDGAKGQDRVKGEGFSLQLTTSQNIDELAARIKVHDVKLDTEPTDMPWGARVFRFHDPDGFKLVISSERKG